MSETREPLESPSILDAVIESAVRQLHAGDVLDVEDLAARHPTIANEIRQLIPVLILAENLRSPSCRNSASANQAAKPGSDATLPTLDHSSSISKSLATDTSAQSSISSVDDGLLYAAMALQCELLAPEQFLSAFEHWHVDRSQSLKQLLIERHPLLRETQKLLDDLLQPVGSRLADQMPGDATYEFTPNSPGQEANPPSARLSPSQARGGVSDTRFQILRTLDRGGLGVVSVALDKELNREVALKEIRNDRAHDRTLQQKFLLEAEVTGGLEHPGIVPIYGLGKSIAGHPYYAMRLIRGSNFQSHIRQFHARVKSGEVAYDGQILRKLLRRFIDICEAIDYAHSRGILHRDIKPVNVMLGRFGETLVVDWGLAKALGVSATASPGDDELGTSENRDETPLVPSGSHESETRDGSIIGTPAYASPEQLGGSISEVGIRSDVYGLGATLYELLCNQAPATGNLLEITLKVRSGQIAPPRSVNPLVPRPLDAICRKAISLRPDERYGSASQLRAEIERWLDDAPVHAMPEPWLAHVRRWVRKHPASASTLTAVVCMSIVGLLAFALIVTRNNANLARLNRDLDNTNSQLVQSNERETLARQTAQEQSELALSTLNAIVNDIQTAIKSMPGGSSARRRMADVVMPRLEKVATSATSQSTINRSTLKSLRELSAIVLQMGADASLTPRGTAPTALLTTAGAQSAARLAQSTSDRALAISIQLMEQAPESSELKLDYVDCCLESGNIAMRLGQQDVALKHFENAVGTCEQLVAANAQDKKFQQRHAIMRIHLGNCIARSKRIEEATKQYQPAIVALRSLLAQAPSDITLARELSIGLQFMADALEMQGQLLEAAKALEEAVTLHKQVFQAEGRPQYIRELAYTLHRQASNQHARSQIQQSLQTTAETIELLEKASAMDPEDRWIQAELANNIELQAKLFKRQGDTSQAAQSFRRCITISESLSQRDPGDLSWKRNLGIAYDNYGKFLSEQGDLDMAFEQFTESLDISRALAQADPTRASNQRDVALSLQSISKLHLKRAQPNQALPLSEEALAILKKLAEADPTNAIKQRDYLIAISYIADIQLALGHPGEALPLYQQGLQLTRQAIADRPQAAELKRDLAIWISLVMSVQLQLNDYEAAVASALEAVELNRSFMEIDAQDSRAKLEYGQALCDAGETLGRVNRVDQADTMLREAIELLTGLLERAPEDSTCQEQLAKAHRNYGDLLTSQSQLEKALAEYQNSQRLLEALVQSKPLNVLWRKEWVASSRRLADCFANQSRVAESQQVLRAVLSFLEEMIARDQDSEWSEMNRQEVQEKLNTSENS